MREQIFMRKLRFKNSDKSNFLDWEVKQMADIGRVYNGLSGKTKENFGKGKPYIQYKQIFDASVIDIDKCGLVEISNEEHQVIVQYGDTFFTVSSETADEIGMSSVLLNDVNEMYLNSFCFGYRPNSLKQLHPVFASFLFRDKIFRNDISRLAQGSTRYNLSKVEVLKLSISLPEYNEQVVIAEFLLSLSLKIEMEIRARELYKTQKEYLLQNMFI